MRLEARGFPAPAGPLDLDAAPGDIILLRGPNGSGKTSLLRALAGLPTPMRPQAVRLDGASPEELPASRLRGLVRVAPQDARDGLAGLTVEGEFRLRGEGGGHPLGERASAELSSGEARRVVLDLARGGRVLLLDEPAEGLDAAARGRLLDLVRDHAREGIVVAADHGGLLDAVATRTVHLGSAAQAPLPAIPRAQGAPILVAPASRVRDVEFPAVSLGPGFHALVGPNGSGKSTLLRALRERSGARLLLPHARDALVRASVAEELAGCDPQTRAALVPSALLPRHPLSLSGGEAQRVALAKSLGQRASCYLLDEPEAHLDAEGRVALATILGARVAEGACILAATHDEGFAALAQSTLRLEARA